MQIENGYRQFQLLFRKNPGTFDNNAKITAGLSKGRHVFPLEGWQKKSCPDDYPSQCKNIDSMAKRSFGFAFTQRCVRIAAIVWHSHRNSSRHGYRFDSSHSSKSNKKLIESVTPPDFTNEISKYQFHVTLFQLTWLLADGSPSTVQVLVPVLENPKLKQNELPNSFSTNDSIIII